MKKLFLFLVVAGFVFASCGPRAPREAAVVEEGEYYSNGYVFEDEVVYFEDGEVLEIYEDEVE